jgi:hypothetical protein
VSVCNGIVNLTRDGKFYYSYEEDAVIMFYLFRYKIIYDRVVFSVKNLNRIINVLKKKNINYCLDDVYQEFDNNRYYEILDKSKLYYELSLDIDNIVNYLNNNIERKYIRRIINKIKVVIDEG